MLKDVHLNTDGDIEIGYDGDLALSTGDDVIVDNILFRLKTYKGDFELEPECGTPLEDVIGYPNIPDTGAVVEDMVTNALTHDGFLSINEINVRVSPLSATKLLVMVTYHSTEHDYAITASLDITTGILEVQ
jgi:hypothetical protein